MLKIQIVHWRRLFSTGANLWKRKYKFIDPLELNFDLPIGVNITNSEWKHFIESKKDFMRKEYISTKIIQKCEEEQSLDKAKSYIRFLTENDSQLNILAKAHYFALLGEQHSKDDKKIFDQLFVELTSDEQLPQKITYQVIAGLCAAGFWKKAESYVENLCSLQNLGHSKILEAYFKKNSFKAAMAKFIEMKDKGVSLSPSALHVVIEHIVKYDSMPLRDLLLQYLSHNKNEINIEVAERLSDEKIFRATLLPIHSGKTCRKCKKMLEIPSFTSNDIQVLKDAYEKNVVISNDIFERSTPEEWDKFKSFLNRRTSFDFVIDGNNFFHISKEYRLSAASFQKNFAKMNTLIITRKHLEWFSKNIAASMPNVLVYTCANDSKDDEFIIYAALHSGLGTKIVSRDFYRSERFRLGDEKLVQLFTEWQQHHHWMFGYNGMPYHSTYQYKMAPQWNKSSKRLHLPVSKFNQLVNVKDNVNWLCIDQS